MKSVNVAKEKISFKFLHNRIAYRPDINNLAKDFNSIVLPTKLFFAF